MDAVHLGKTIKELRVKNKLTQKELAERLNLTDKAISKWERGLNFPDITLFPKIAEALNVDLKTLLMIEENESLPTAVFESSIALVTEQQRGTRRKLSVAAIFYTLMQLLIAALVVLGMMKSSDAAKENAKLYFAPVQELLHAPKSNAMWGSTFSLSQDEGQNFLEMTLSTKVSNGMEEFGDKMVLYENSTIKITATIQKGEAKLLLLDQNQNILYYEKLREDTALPLEKGEYTVFLVSYWFTGKVSVSKA